MIRFEKVDKNYTSHPALSQITCQINKGEMVFLTGHSGAGKSTLLKLIMQIEKPSRGNIFISNKNLNRLTERQIPYYRRQIGMVFQNPRLLTNRTIFDNIALPLIISGTAPREVSRRVRAALHKVNLHGKENCLPIQLSYGEQQRVGIARAVVNKPQILLADEPTGNLDPDLATEIMTLFSSFNEVGVTVLIATHNLNIIQNQSYRIMTLEKGTLIKAEQINPVRNKCHV